MKELKKYKKAFVAGSSLLESVIAVTIIATCLLIAISIYAAVLNNSSSIDAYKVKFKINQLVSEMKASQQFDDEMYELKNYTIKKKVSNVEGNKELKKIEFAVYIKSDTLTYNFVMRGQ